MSAVYKQAAKLTDIDSVLKERGGRYGAFRDQAALSQELQNVIREHLLAVDKEIVSDQMEALQMICGKISRIVNGDPDYADSWVDIAGYATLIADRLEGKIQ